MTDPGLDARVLIVALNTYTAPYNDGKLEYLSKHLAHLAVATGDVPTLWDRRSTDRPPKDFDLEVMRTRFDRRPVSAVLSGLGEVVRAARPDLVHVECEPWQAVALQSVAWAQRLKVPVGIQFAENGPQFRGAGGYLRRRVAALVLRRCDYAIGWSSESASIASQLNPSLEVRAFPGTGIGDVTETPGPPASDQWFGTNSAALPKIAFVGRLSPEKGVRDFLSVSDALAAETPIRAAIAGDGPEAQVVSSWAATRPWAHVHGVLPRPTVLGLLSSSDVLLCPSRALPHVKEQFGKAAVEAMAMGTPAVAYDCGALGEVIGNGGVVVPEGEQLAMVSATQQVLCSPSPERLQRIEAGRVQASQFTDEAVGRQLLNLWRRFL